MQVICDKFPHCLLFRLTILLVAILVNQVQANDPHATLREQFLLSASQDNVDALREFLAQGVDVDIRDENGRTALLLATYHDAVKSAQLLIEAGADVNAMDDIHDSPYLYASAEDTHTYRNPEHCTKNRPRTWFARDCRAWAYQERHD